MNISNTLGLNKITSSPVAIGGSVLAIIQKLKKNIRKKPAFDTSTYSVPIYNMDVIPVTSRQQESYSFQSEVTKHPVEDGTPFTDHVILQPIRLDLTFEISNWDAGKQASESLIDAVQRWRNRQPLVIVTEHSFLVDMVCISLQFDNTAPYWGALKGRASFQQVNQVKLVVSSPNPNQVTPTDNTSGASVQLSASPTQNLGDMTIQSRAPESLYYSL